MVTADPGSNSHERLQFVCLFAVLCSWFRAASATGLQYGRRARADRLSQTVFVLEDDTDISRLVQHHLEAAGFSVTPFLHPQPISFPTPSASRPPLFLLDIMVPGGDGLDVCRRLRSQRRAVDHSHHLSYRPRRRKRPRSRPGARRRRLHHQALCHPRTGGPRQGCSAPFRAPDLAIGHQL